ncbi:unnamed protein product [Mortierella alpina]
MNPIAPSSLSHESSHMTREGFEPVPINTIHPIDLASKTDSYQMAMAVPSPHANSTFAPISHLPAEIIHHILHHLTMGQLRRCLSVSRQFRRAARTVCMDKLSGLGSHQGRSGCRLDTPSTALSLWWHHTLTPWSSSHAVQLQCIRAERALEQLYFQPVDKANGSITIDVTPEPTFHNPFHRPKRLFENILEDTMLEQMQAARYKGPAVGLDYFDYCTGKRTHRSLCSGPLACSFPDYGAETISSSLTSAQTGQWGSGQCFSVVGISHGAWSKTTAPNVARDQPWATSDMSVVEGRQRVPMMCLLPEWGCDMSSTDQQQRSGQFDFELGVQRHDVLPGCGTVEEAGRSPIHCHAMQALSPWYGHLSSRFTCFCCVHHSPFLDEDADGSVGMALSVPQERRCETEAWSVEYSVGQEAPCCRSCASEPEPRTSRRRRLVRIDVKQFCASLDFVLSGPLV